MSVLNEHQAFLAYQDAGLAGLAGQPTSVQLELARHLTLHASQMDERHPSTEIVKRDVAQIYRQAYPEEQRAPNWQRGQADQVIAELQRHPAYLDAKHADHATVAAQMREAYAVRYQGES